MNYPVSSNDDDHALIAEIEATGGIIRRSKSGQVLSIDFREAHDRVSDELVSKLAEFRRLKELYLNDAKISDDCLPFILRLPRLQVLNLDGTPISDSQMDLVSQHSNLQLLSLSRTQVTSQTVARMRKKMIGTRIVFR